MNKPRDDFLFVYGTLRRAAGHPMHRLLAGRAEPAGHGFVRGRLYDVGEFPALVSDPKGGTVAGEIHRLLAPQSAFAELDRYEGFDPASPASGEFRRARVTVTFDDGRAAAAWAYVWNRPVLRLAPILHGDYARFLREESAPAGAQAVGFRVWSSPPLEFVSNFGFGFRISPSRRQCAGFAR